MFLLRFRSYLWVCLGTLGLCLFLQLPVQSQTALPKELPSSDTLSPSRPLIIPKLPNSIVSDWIWIDGRRLFQIAASEDNLSERTQAIQDNLQNIQTNYLNANAINPQVEIKTEKNLPVIYIDGQYLLTITSLDAELIGIAGSGFATQIKSMLETALKRSRTERQPQNLKLQGIFSIGIFVVVLLCSLFIQIWQRRLKQPAKAVSIPTVDAKTKLPPVRFRVEFTGILRQILGIFQVSIWVIGILLSLDRFPYTRTINVWVLKSLSIPLTLMLVGLSTHLLIRLSCVLVNRFASALMVTPFLTPVVSTRVLLRISTIANVIKGIVVPIWSSIGIIVVLICLKVDVGPLLAGVGLIGVAISLASQSLIKDAINGFLVILEDQFGVGDIIRVGEFTGVVETLNLRITQIRNAEGQLITVPNSEISIVANLSSDWSRVDLNIPIPYNANVDQMLDLIQSTAVAMAEDPTWQPHILEAPQLKGIDDFDNRGPIVKIWIKTQPLQQWTVSRELRRRLKIAFDQADIAIPVSQQSIWIHSLES